MSERTVPVSAGNAKSSQHLLGASFLVLLAVLGIDFHLDVRGRDVFSWMDPHQYYEFAVNVLRGHEQFLAFEVPSIFPFLLMPALSVDPSIPAALWTNFAFTALLLASIHGLCRHTAISTPSPIVALLVLSSPLLIGLSRSGYVEYALSAVVAGTFVLWLRFLRRRDRVSGGLLGVAVGLGFLLKMTFPLFLILPVGAAVGERMLEGRPREAVSLLQAVVVPIAAGALIQIGFFPLSLGYYASLGNTGIPIMHLIGPPEWLSWSSAAFYFGELGRTMLRLLTPFLAIAALASFRKRVGPRALDLTSPTATLWLWLLGPLLLLILQPVKEPRHVAPCVVPAVLLVVLGIESLRARALRLGLFTAAVALAAVQFVTVTSGRLETPYFIDRPLHWEEISQAMTRSVVLAPYRHTPEAERPIHWKFNQNVVVAGFPANEALALTWQLFPGVVFDLETLEDPERLSAEIPYRRFEDLYILTAFNTYNRRSGWHEYYATLSRDAVIENADFVIVGDEGAADPSPRFPSHSLVESIPRDDGFVHVLRSRRPTTQPYRALYAREFLARNPALPEAERRVVMQELLTVAALGGHRARADAILHDHPILRSDEPALRNIYWIGGYETITRLMRERTREPRQSRGEAR